LKDEPALEREDVVAIVLPLPSTIVNRSTLENFEMVKVFPETVALHLVNVTGVLNWERSRPRERPLVMPQATVVEGKGRTGRDAWANVADADCPVDTSVMVAVRVWVDGERVIEAENVSPGLTVRGSVGGRLPGALGAREITIKDSYVGVGLPWAQWPSVTKKNKAPLEFPTTRATGPSWALRRIGWHVTAGWIHSAVAWVISPDDTFATYPPKNGEFIFDTWDKGVRPTALTWGTVAKEASTSPMRAESRRVILVLFFGIFIWIVGTLLAI
jgi:hypothetical protein